MLARHEVPVVDSPLVQRLRGIHQTALAYLVYPSATHSRFGHSLGVANMVQAMVQSLRACGQDTEISPSALQRVRLAAILHDCGHLLFSHLGEEIASSQFAHSIREAKQAYLGLFEAKSLSEIVSYLMVTSPSFASELDNMLQSAGLNDVNSSRIAPLILGRSEDPAQQYEADMLSGPFDADKLDYLLRDCHFSGIRTTVDIERVSIRLRLLSHQRPPVIGNSYQWRADLKQILFCRDLMLYTSVYHHQKVRAAECSFRGITERLQDNTDTLLHSELKLRTLVDWLNLTEDKLFVLGLTEPVVAQPVKNLLNRRLLKRALVISVDTVTESAQAGLVAVYNDADLAQEVEKSPPSQSADRMNKRERKDVADLSVDVPDPPTVIKDVVQVKITADQQSHHPLSTNRFQWDKWTNNYGEVKWRAHVSCYDADATRRSAARAATQVLKDTGTASS